MTTCCGDQSIIDRVRATDGIVLISRGGLTWIRELLVWGAPIWICRGSRLDAEPFRWILRPPDGVRQVVLFDRSVTTGCTVVRARAWLENQGYGVMVIGSVDPLCRLGLKAVDAVVRPEEAGLKLWDRDRFLDRFGAGGWFSLVVSEGPIPGGSLPLVELPPVPADMDGMVRLANNEPPGDVIIRPGAGWDRESVLIYTHLTGKPAVFIGGADADYRSDELAEIIAWLRQAAGGGSVE